MVAATADIANAATAGNAVRSVSTRSWRQSISTNLLISDLLVVAATVFVTQYFWLGLGARLSEDLPYWLVSGAITALWTWTLGLNDSRSHRILGTGWTEYLRVIGGSFRLFGFIAIVAYLAKVDLARGYFLLTLPIGLAALLLSRAVWRRWLLHRRAVGAYSAHALLVGSRASVANLAHELKSAPGAGFTPVGACVPSTDGEAFLLGTEVPIVGTFSTVIDAMHKHGADTVVIASADDLSATEVKRISWGLEAGRQHLVLAPGIMDIAGPRMHVRPVAGLPLIHVETPTFSQGQRFTKRAVDLVASGIGIVVLSPLLLVLALIVRLTSPGPALFYQERVGRNGKHFRMLKFRSMVQGAEDQLEMLRARQAELGNEVLFKMRDDPRITKVGRVMRKFSLDELPQLFNVFAGNMSLIGPRPPLPAEVEKYAEHVHRRFLMKPGITGPWQVGGRSTLSWEESVRLDLSYVENWSLANDMLILFKTVKVVLAPGETAA
ncbi:Undecaprenyl-phosphate galactose phosphotransferase, WbaP/exopolysaccharide biosynthesis polyprenyl glycosylphosphotransferase [Microbacterium sp. 8M]|uniref:sugar transferase n=1 Tax=Microbacterium sp. 8M TaxID=2653153 RepID=UPI0012F16409|nr:sugar transferase [Microbacterium sp. 8M]VXB73529.1 Undecaprenyl-phosphate galactose phosphotransferase, WbaP/exopolysaccharide biosynthesis polyprenyl glycosylphosphotransferase [Microbacterium sp. 8M]